MRSLSSSCSSISTAVLLLASLSIIFSADTISAFSYPPSLSSFSNKMTTAIDFTVKKPFFYSDNYNINDNNRRASSLCMVSATERILQKRTKIGRPTKVKSRSTTRTTTTATTTTKTRRRSSTSTKTTKTRRGTTASATTSTARTPSSSSSSLTSSNKRSSPPTESSTTTTVATATVTRVATNKHNKRRKKSRNRSTPTVTSTRTTRSAAVSVGPNRRKRSITKATKSNNTEKEEIRKQQPLEITIAKTTVESIYNLPTSFEATNEDWEGFVLSSSTTTSSSTTNSGNNDIYGNIQNQPQQRQHMQTLTKPKRSTKTQNSNKSETTSASSNSSLSSSSFTTNTNTKRRNKSSTMPGFRNNNKTLQRKSFRDGLQIVTKANAKNPKVAASIKKALNTEASKSKRGKVNSEAMYSSSASVPDSLIAFTNEIHKEARITPKEEVKLGTLTQEAIRLQSIYDNLIHEYGRDPSDDEWCAAAGKINMEALQNAIQDGIEAKNQLVTSNLRMVQGVVNLYIRNGLGSQYNAGDLMQEGTVALIRAAEKFDPQRGFRFSTYAMYWIRSAVKRSQILQSRVINVPQRLHETHKKVGKLQSQLKKELGRKPTRSDLAIAAGLTETQLDRCLKAISQQVFSLDAEIKNTLKPNSGGKNTETQHNLISAKYDDVEYRDLQSHFMKEDLVGTLKRYLSPHEVDLLLLRYGLMDEKTLPYGFSGPLTIAEVSRLVGLKPDKVRRVINKSLRQLRHLIAHEWEDFESELQTF